jgi:Rrf2 family protein
MRLSRRSEYGLRALVDLIRHQGEGPIALVALAERDRLPAKFLEQILATLKHAGIVRTTLGAHGGYEIATDPTTVSVGRVIRLLDGALAPLGCVSLRYYQPCSCPDEATCALRDVMIDVRDAMLEILDKETLAELAARQGRADIDPRHRHADALGGLRP